MNDESAGFWVVLDRCATIMLMPEIENNDTQSELPHTEVPGTVISPVNSVQAVVTNDLPQAVIPQSAPTPINPANAIPVVDVPLIEAHSTPDNDAVSWTASEFIAHQKSAGWYGMLIGVALIIAVIIYLLTKDLITTSFVIFGAFILGYYGSRQPRELNYQLDAGGVAIGDKHYDYDAFRSFSIVTEGAFSSVIFMPLKRFAPLRAIYFAPEIEERIVNMLTPRLPFEEYNHDAVDRLMRHIRF